MENEINNNEDSKEEIKSQSVSTFIATNILAGGLAFVGNLLFSWIYNKFKKQP